MAVKSLLETRYSGRSRPSDKEGGGRSFRPWDKVGARAQKNFFSAFRASVSSKNKAVGELGGGGWSPGPLPWIRHCKVEGELRAILRLSMRIYDAELKLARFIHITLRENVLNSRQLPEYFGILAAAWSYRSLQNKCIFLSQEKFTGYCWEFKGKWTI